MSNESFADKFFIYNGTKTIEEMIENIEKLQLEKSKCFYINLGGQFYAVFFESFDKEVIVGREKVFYTQNGRLVESTIAEAQIGFSVNAKNVRFITDTLARELNELFNPIEIYEYPTIKSKNIRKVERQDILLSNYMVILGVTFASKFYDLSDIEEVERYFVHAAEQMSFLRRTKGAVSIDPFSQFVRFKDGRIGTYSYRRVEENNYHRNRPNSYYNGRTYKTIFALQETNLYSPFRKREWPSLTRYQHMYPNDNILYQKPDYREGQPICKWCGCDLPEKKKSYCSIDCRLEFGKAVNLERSALIPYLIMCRDNFTCKTCGKDMARINEHGMKIPIAISHEKPDKDGVFRSDAEVDHIKPVEEGGEDHQSNLATICQDCHKKKHKKRKTKAEKEEINVTPSKTTVIELKDKNKGKKVTSTSRETNTPFATPKQLSYLQYLAGIEGYEVINKQSMWSSIASNLIGFFLKGSAISPSILEEYLRKK